MHMSGLIALALLLPAHAAPTEEDAPPATEAAYAMPDLDMVVRIPVGDPDSAWLPPSWALSSDSSLALEKQGQQLIAMYEELSREFQPTFRAETAPEVGQALAMRFLSSTYAGPELGQINWDGFALIDSPTLGQIIEGKGAIELPGREDETGRIIVDLVPVRAGVDAIALVGVATPEEADAALAQLTAMTAFYDGPLAWDQLPIGHVVEDAGYEIDLPEGFRALTERERLALNGEPVGGNSGFGGALAYQTFLDPSTLDGWRSFACVAFSADTLEVVDPDKAPRLGANYRLASQVMLKGGSYKVSGGKDIRGRSADLLDARNVQVDPTDAGTLHTIDLGDRDGYLWRGTGDKSSTGGETQAVQIATFYTAWDDVNLQCQAVAPGDKAELLDQFEASMRTLRVTDGIQHPLTLGLMARYKRWWPYSNPLAQLYWLPIPIVLFAAWLANRGD